jgi:type II restriction enzyme
VIDLLAVHRSLITHEIIQKRNPLAATARRAGWIGCNILLHLIPPEGRISVIQNGTTVAKADSRARFSAAERLTCQLPTNRSWSRSLLNILHRLPKGSFSLATVYRFEDELVSLYPHNQHIRAKIRQQLQVLRDAGLLIFEGRGKYRLRYELV